MSESSKIPVPSGGVVWAIFAIAAATLLFLAGLALLKIGYGQQETELTHPRSASSSASCIPLPLDLSLCPTDDREAGPAAQREREDLATQREMADWAAVVAAVSVASLGLSFVGVVLVYATWQKTAETVRQSAEATVAASKSADAAERALIVDNRPWLKISLTHIGPVDFPRKEIEVGLRVENVGKSPALYVTAYVDGFIVRMIQPDKTHVRKVVERHVESGSGAPLMSASILPGEPLDTVALGRISELETPNFNKTVEVDFLMLCTVVYSTTLVGTPFHTTMAYRLKSGENWLRTDQRYEVSRQNASGEEITLIGGKGDPRLTSVS